jgi:hypothetical protein
MQQLNFDTRLHANDNWPPVEMETPDSPTSRLRKLLRLLASFPKGDDPVCLGALDCSTLKRFGYNEREIIGLKQQRLM